MNTEHMKLKNSQANCSATPIGCPKSLAELIRRGTYNPLDLQSLSVQSAGNLLFGIPCKQATIKVSLAKRCTLYNWQLLYLPVNNNYNIIVPRKCHAASDDQVP